MIAQFFRAQRLVKQNCLYTKSIILSASSFLQKAAHRSIFELHNKKNLVELRMIHSAA